MRKSFRQIQRELNTAFFDAYNESPLLSKISKLNQSRRKGRKPKNRVVYKIWDSVAGEWVGVYSRAYHTDTEFKSESEARTSNVHDLYQDVRRYKIRKFKVRYEEEK